MKIKPNNELNECDLKRLQALSDGALSSFVIQLSSEPVFPQDVYTVSEVARLLGISEPRVRYFAKVDSNPLPLRTYPNGARGSFVLRDELIEWLKSYSIKSGEMHREYSE